MTHETDAARRIRRHRAEDLRRAADAAEAAGVPAMPMVSGAVHDAQQMAAICPVAMVFVQSRGGLSHTPAEFTALEHAVAGVEVLTRALHALAY